MKHTEYNHTNTTKLYYVLLGKQCYIRLGNTDFPLNILAFLLTASVARAQLVERDLQHIKFNTEYGKIPEI